MLLEQVQLLGHHFCFSAVLTQCHSMLPACVIGENDSERTDGLFSEAFALTPL